MSVDDELSSLECIIEMERERERERESCLFHSVQTLVMSGMAGNSMRRKGWLELFCWPGLAWHLQDYL